VNLILTSRLSLMLFVQYFIWGAWGTTLGNYMGTIDMGESIPLAYSLGPIASVVAPFFLGMVADRFFDSEKVLGVLCVVSGVALLLMPSFAGTALFLPLLFLHALCYFPTLGLTASLAFHHLTNPEKEFPIVRVFGTIGWIAAGIVVSKILQADFESTPLYVGGGAAIFLGIYSFTLPRTPPPSAGKETSWRQILGIDALKQLKTRSFMVFLFCAMLTYIAFGTYFPYAPVYLAAVGIENPGFQMTFGQMSEIFFMLLIPYFFRRLGVKWMLLIGMLAWFVRFGLFAGAAIDGVYVMILIGILVHGVCFDFFVVTGQIYIDKKTSPEIRGQVQGLLVLLTYGVGFLIGTQLSGLFVNTLGEDGTLLPPEWRVFWGVFAIAALIFALFFYFMFDDTVEDKESVKVVPV
jgi:nucleoside transporter